jgi:hypothetical protein
MNLGNCTGIDCGVGVANSVVLEGAAACSRSPTLSIAAYLVLLTLAYVSTSACGVALGFAIGTASLSIASPTAVAVRVAVSTALSEACLATSTDLGSGSVMTGRMLGVTAIYVLSL